MKNLCFSLIVFFASCFHMHAQNTQFKIISNQNNSIVVDFILTDYVIDDYKVLDGDMHQKIKALDAVAILKKGHPEVLKFTTNLQMPNEGVSSVNVISTSFDTKSDINLIPSKVIYIETLIQRLFLMKNLGFTNNTTFFLVV